ncbi:hypothetical protein [Streptomyces sp. WMMB303]|uniref:hypothetical protein n=1 Tax=Streptomyces sp. WMMB303 TaxID=3034154 RepID=UPI0023EC1062|nr:hypothetical protein [Streptomyces sp. WMMB303]MDF4250933.1 hypothetical protein [Streptomyces sp. WMMB303]
MAISYDDIVNADFSDLETAAKSWEGMGKRFGTLGGHYRDHVRAAVDADSWQGEGAKMFGKWGGKTAEEYDQAEEEARGVGALFRLAHATFESHKKAVEKARDDAQAAGMDVNSHGHCTMNLDKVEAKKGKKVADRYRENSEAKAKVEAEWTDSIKKAVKEAQAADGAMKAAFMADPKEPDEGLPDGFNGSVGDDAVKAGANRAAKTYKSLNEGQTPSPEELREAAMLTRGLGDDPEFSRTLINSLGGPEGLIKAHNRLDDLAYSDDKEHRKTYVSLDQGLAKNLASATKNPETTFYKKFQEEMRKAGLSKFDLKVAENVDGGGPGQKIRGYQSLVSLMQRADGDEYDKQFLTDTADAVRDAEEKSQGGHSDVWDLRGDFHGKKYAHFADDPYDGLLKIMSDQPDVSAEYLDPAENDNLQYLLHDRDWKHVDMGDGAIGGHDPDKESKDAREGLGLVIEAGTTGREPGSPGEIFGRHTPTEARIMHDTVNWLDYGHPDGDGDPEDNRIGEADKLLKQESFSKMRTPLARALSSYIPDIVDTISADSPGGRSGDPDPLLLGNESQIQNGRASLLRVMRGVSEDSDNYLLLHGASGRYMAEQLADTTSDVGNRAAKVGETFGAITAIGADLDLSEYDATSEKNGDQRVYGYHLVGSLANAFPIVGDVAQRSVDSYWHEWLKAAESENSYFTRDAISSENQNTEDALDHFLERSGKAGERSEEWVDTAQREAGQSYVKGRRATFGALRVDS